MGTAYPGPRSGLRLLWRQIFVALTVTGLLTASSVFASEQGRRSAEDALSKPAFELWEVSELRRYAPEEKLQKQKESKREPAGIPVEDSFNISFPDNTTGARPNQTPAPWPSSDR